MSSATRRTRYSWSWGARRRPQTAEAVGAALSEVEEDWRRLHEVHALVLDLPWMEIRMANPFSP